MEKDKKSNINKIVVSMFVILLLLSTAATYYKLVIVRDYVVQQYGVCNPDHAKCFVRECDPEYEDCDVLGDMIEFSIFEVSAQHLEICDPRVEDCLEYLCTPSNPDCKLFSCVEGEFEYSCS